MNIETILVVDDCEPDQFLAKIMLESAYPGIEVLQAYDGQEALSLINARGKEPDIILLDINMPRMDGHAFLAEYCPNRTEKAVVMMLTSSYQATDKENAETYECVSKYLTKPLDKETLKEITL